MLGHRPEPCADEAEANLSLEVQGRQKTPGVSVELVEALTLQRAIADQPLHSRWINGRTLAECCHQLFKCLRVVAILRGARGVAQTDWSKQLQKAVGLQLRCFGFAAQQHRANRFASQLIRQTRR
ncbi:hypothetical protein D3C87_1669740 [compost metagenome]